VKITRERRALPEDSPSSRFHRQKYSKMAPFLSSAINLGHRSQRSFTIIFLHPPQLSEALCSPKSVCLIDHFNLFLMIISSASSSQTTEIGSGPSGRNISRRRNRTSRPDEVCAPRVPGPDLNQECPICAYLRLCRWLRITLEVFADAEAS
jgi:hypothetical protein